MAISISIFISHSWNHFGHYDKLSDWIFGQNWSTKAEVPIEFIDKSIPRDNPIHNAPNERALRQAILAEIRLSHLVIIPTGMYTTHSKWIQKEIDGARELRRPILAVDPWGQIRKSSIVIDNAAESVGWTMQSVVNGIMKLYDTYYK